MSTKNELTKFDSVELLSLYTTMVLKRLVTVYQQHIDDELAQLVRVLEHNLNQLKIEKKWFFGTLRDHARLFNSEWRLNSSEEADNGMVCYNTLLLVVALRLGLEKLWVNDGRTPVFNNILIEELSNLYHPNKIKLSLKQMMQYKHRLLENLSNYSPDLEELYMPRSDVNAFQNGLKFKNLRVLELGGRISDKVMCNGLWSINKKSDKVLEMAIKDSKGSESWTLSLPHLEVLRNNALGDNPGSMKLSLGAAALIIQPKITTVDAVTFWDTNRAIMHVLDTEAKLKGSSKVDRKLHLTRIVVDYTLFRNDLQELERIFKACPSVVDLALPYTNLISDHISLLLGMIPVKQVRKLELNATNMSHQDFTVLLAAMSNLKELTLEITPTTISQHQGFYPSTHDSDDIFGAAEFRPELMPRNLETLTLDFANTDLELDQGCDMEREFGRHMMVFLSNFGSVKKVNYQNTVFLPPPFLVFGCLAGALAVLQNMKHISVTSCEEDIPGEDQGEEDSSYTNPLLNSQYVQAHFARVPQILPYLQREETFQHMCELETIELDECYLSPRVDRMVAALRASGVLVNIVYRSGKVVNPNPDYTSQMSFTEKIVKKFAKSIYMESS